MYAKTHFRELPLIYITVLNTYRGSSLDLLSSRYFNVCNPFTALVLKEMRTRKHDTVLPPRAFYPKCYCISVKEEMKIFI
jgi:hypothetical protein